MAANDLAMQEALASASSQDISYLKGSEPSTVTVKVTLVHTEISHIFLQNSIPNNFPVNSSPPEQNDRHLADDILKCIFMNEKFCILIQISLMFVPKDPIDNKSALVQVMAWRRNRRQAITWDNVDPVHWHILLYVALGKTS